MDLIAAYSDEEEEIDPEKIAQQKKVAALNEAALSSLIVAPHVDIWDKDKGVTHLDPKNKAIFHNPKIETFMKPIVGPIHPSNVDSLYAGHRNHLTGHLEKAHISSFHFDEQFHSFEVTGVAADPSNSYIPGKRSLGYVKKGDAVGSDEAAPKKARGTGGRWGGFEDEEGRMQELANEAEARRQEIEDTVIIVEDEDAAKAEERVTSIFHGKNPTDYQNRSWLAKPPGMEQREVNENRAAFLPKKWVHTWVGHTMGVNAIRWLPESHHMFLSASMDAKIKIWDFGNQRKCMRTYMGHDQGVRDIQFTDGGKKFYSASFDKTICLWDTETGQVINNFSNKKIPYCIAVHPQQPNVFVAGCDNKKAVQWDADTGKITQEYDEHLGAVHTVTFMDDAKRLVTTSDDKKIFIWEFGIPVVTKHIAEPHMHSVPAITVHPTGKWFVGQSMDNQIICMEAQGRFKYLPRKVFRGHSSAGYAIRPGFSPDGKYIMSGDANGKLWFWDFKNMRNYRTIKAHESVVMDCLWHPYSQSRVVTASWDGTIKLWD